jgi:hypothetical protein
MMLPDSLPDVTKPTDSPRTIGKRETAPAHALIKLQRRRRRVQKK